MLQGRWMLKSIFFERKNQLKSDYIFKHVTKKSFRNSKIDHLRCLLSAFKPKIQRNIGIEYQIKVYYKALFIKHLDLNSHCN